VSALADAAWVRWLAMAGLVVLFCGLAFVTWWALFSDRSRDRRRCPRCWYDLTYSPGMTCGECGHTGHDERAFGRTRRRRTLALMSMVGCALTGVYLIDHVKTVGLMSYVPSRALIMLLPAVNERNAAVADEIKSRLRTGDLSDGHLLALLSRCAAGDGGARPPSLEWREKYGSMARRSARLLMSGAEDPADRDHAADVVVRIASTDVPEIDLLMREVWPMGVRPTIDTLVRDWWDAPGQLRISAMPDLPGIDGVEPDVHICRDEPIQRRSYSLFLPALPEGEHAVSVALTFERRARDGKPWIAAGETVVEVPLRIENDLSDTLTAVSGDEYDALIRGVFRQGIAKWKSGSLPVRIFVDRGATTSDLMDGIVVAIRIDLLRNGRLARQLDTWWMAGPGTRRQVFPWEVPFGDDEILTPPHRPGEDDWQFRIRSMPELALRVEGAKRYWSGDVTIPAAVTTRRGAAPPRGWIPDSGDAPAAAEGTAAGEGSRDG